MKFALVTHVVGKNDGQGRINYEVAQALLEQGHNITIIAEHCDEDIYKQSGAHWVRISPRVPSRLLKDFFFALASTLWLRRHRHMFDLVQANGFVTFARADVVAAHFIHTAWLKNPAYPFQWLPFRSYAWYQRLYSLIHSRMEKLAFRKARLCIAVSLLIAHDLENLGIPQSHICVVNNGVEKKDFFPGPQERKAFRLPENRQLVLFVGDLMTPRKNLDTVLRALALTDDLELVITGKGQAEDIVEKTRHYGVEHRIHFLGRTEEISRLMRSVDVFVFPSWYEPFGMVTLEAASVGIPIVLSRNVGAADIFKGLAYLIDTPGDFRQLADRLQEASETPDPKASEALRQCAATWTAKRMVTGYLEAYERLLQENA